MGFVQQIVPGRARNDLFRGNYMRTQAILAFMSNHLRDSVAPVLPPTI